MSEDKDGNEEVVLTPEQLRRRRNRSIAIGVALVALVFIMIAITMVRGPVVALVR